MTAFFSTLLTQVLVYGYPIVVGMIICAGFAIPLPVTITLLMVGSLCASGEMNLWTLLILCASSAIVSDSIGYFLGWKYGKHLLTWVTRWHLLSQADVEKTVLSLHRWGYWLVFFTRWLLTPLGIPVNVVAGMTMYSFWSFLSMVIVGEVLWVSLYIGIGYYIGASWVTFQDYITQTPQVITFLFIGILFVWMAVSYRKGSVSKKNI